MHSGQRRRLENAVFKMTGKCAILNDNKMRSCARFCFGGGKDESRIYKMAETKEYQA